jgi:hypothetical protein
MHNLDTSAANTGSKRTVVAARAQRSQRTDGLSKEILRSNALNRMARKLHYNERGDNNDQRTTGNIQNA